MYRVVRLRPPSIEVSIRSQVKPRRIYGGQSGTKTDMSSCVLFFYTQYHPTSASYSFIIMSIKSQHLRASQNDTLKRTGAQ